jgi:prepilin-type N-terminal cleavage/methylation domain-containing protein
VAVNLRREDGFTLIEVLLVSVLGLIVLGATLTSFDHFYRASNENQKLNDAIEIARNAEDRASRQLRNLANQNPQLQTATISLADPTDLIFQTSDPSRKWVRYCLATAASPGAPNATTSRGQLWESESSNSNSPTGAMTGPCPGAGWASQHLVADRVTNMYNSQNRSVFVYGCVDGAPVGCPIDPDDNVHITNILTRLWVDTNPGRTPSEERVVSAVFLRNQNEKPTADGVAPAVSGIQHAVLLNATRSNDPEGRTLFYDWVWGGPTLSQAFTSNEACDPDLKQHFPPQNTSRFPGATYIGSGIAIKYQFPANLQGTVQTVQLIVRDPGCLYDVKNIQVRVP